MTTILREQVALLQSPGAQSGKSLLLREKGHGTRKYIFSVYNIYISTLYVVWTLLYKLWIFFRKSARPLGVPPLSNFSAILISSGLTLETHAPFPRNTYKTKLPLTCVMLWVQTHPVAIVVACSAFDSV